MRESAAQWQYTGVLRFRLQAGTETNRVYLLRTGKSGAGPEIPEEQADVSGRENRACGFISMDGTL